MSVRVMADVWEYSKQKGSAKLLLLAIADHCNDDRTSWPSVARLCKKCCLTERFVHKLLKDLQQKGELTIEVGAGPHGCSLYHIPDLGVLPSAGGGAAQCPKGVLPTAPKPSVNHQEPSYGDGPFSVEGGKEPVDTEDGLDVFAGNPVPESTKKKPAEKERKPREVTAKNKCSSQWDGREPTESMRYFFGHKTPPRWVQLKTFQYDEWLRIEKERGATTIYEAIEWALRNNVAVGQLLSAASKWGNKQMPVWFYDKNKTMAQEYVPDVPNPAKVHGGDGPIRQQSIAQLHSNLIQWERSADNAKMRPDDVSHRWVKAYRKEIEKRGTM